MEKQLLQYNKNKIKESNLDEKVVSRIKNIEKDLKTLQSIKADNCQDDDHVEAIGSKLNRLWRRLTGSHEQKYEPEVMYKLSKTDLETLYETAKQRVLTTFQAEKQLPNFLLDQTNVFSNNNSFSNWSSPVQLNIEENEEVAQKNDEKLTEKTDEENSNFQPIQTEEVEAEVEADHSKEVSLDVEDIISKVTDITENINEFLSSQTNIDEELIDPFPVVSCPPLDSAEIENENTPESSEPTLIVEHFSNDAQTTDDKTGTSNNEVITDKIPSDSNDNSSDNRSNDDHVLTEESFDGKNESDFEKRLKILNDGLEELSESLEKAPLMDVGRMEDVSKDNQEEIEELSITVEQEYSTDKDFTGELKVNEEYKIFGPWG